MSVQLSDQLLKSMAMAKVFKDNTETVNSMDFFENGKYLVTASEDNSVRLYDAITGQKKTMLNSLKYGVDVVRFTHHDYSVICASNNGWDETLRYWSLHDNSYMRYFKGHRSRVEAIAMSPVNDTFLSGSLDNTVRLWDLRTNVCQGIIQRRGRPAVAFDPQGLIFGVTCSNNQVKLFDSRSFDKGAFATFSISYDTQFEWGTMKFSPDGHHILLSTTCDAVFVMDSFEGELKQIFTERKNPRKTVFEASFTPDSRYVLSGGEDGSIHVWSLESGREVTALKGQGAPVKNVQWNPAYGSMASTCENVTCMWLPNLE